MMETNYSKAWLKFRKSKEYKEVTETMSKQRISQPYSSNILKIAFAAGWNATGTEIKILPYWGTNL